VKQKYYWLYTLVFLLINGGGIQKANAQEWAVPEGLERTFLGGLCIGNDSLRASYLVGTYYSFASRAFKGLGNYEASKNFSDYRRQGLWLRADYRLGHNLNLGLTIPYYISSIKLSNNPTKTFFQRGVSEIRMRAGYDIHRGRVAFFAGLSAGLPVQEGRISLTSPEIPLGNDAYWNLGCEAGISWFSKKEFGFLLHSSLNLRIAQSGYIVWSDTLRSLLGEPYSSIQATINRRDYFTTTASFRIPWEDYVIVAGYNFYYEWPDYADNIAPELTPEMLAWVKQVMGQRATLHGISAGVMTSWGPFQAGLIGKAYFAGRGGIAENSVSLMVRYLFNSQ
jgi:hypothetical protein